MSMDYLEQPGHDYKKTDISVFWRFENNKPNAT